MKHKKFLRKQGDGEDEEEESREDEETAIQVVKDKKLEKNCKIRIKGLMEEGYW